MSVELVEMLAAIEHERWTGWMRYQFTRGAETPEGFLLDPVWVARWRRLMETPYADLTEQEKESDRVEARKSLAAVTL